MSGQTSARTEPVGRLPLELHRMVFDDPCDGCGTRFVSGDLSVVTPGCEFYCSDCVAKVYEAMKAAQPSS